ncbi:MAG: type III pantothenate kinase [Candidatus Omnitrophica bacterium]|nr:type III pantothenate kinase [Candidatus Omnitrophota bacterium]MDD5574069.1 type III pantothenate kinase [Candidatus Omnitrophota bacterium]
MTVAIDIGNTNTTVGILEGSKVLSSFKIPTAGLGNARGAAAALFKGRLRPFLGQCSEGAVYACSVVPQINPRLRLLVKRVLGTACKIAGEDFCVPLLNKYRIPSQVGQDRLVNAYAALKLFGKGLIVVDFGTAITFDIVSRKEEYLGGLIAPGLRLMQESLNKKTALLPFVELAKPIELIGRDTASSIRAGIVYGAASLCDGIIGRLLEKECRGYQVVVTGGDASLVKSFSRYMKTVDEHLILEGLAMLAESQKTGMRKPY